MFFPRGSRRGGAFPGLFTDEPSPNEEPEEFKIPVRHQCSPKALERVNQLLRQVLSQSHKKSDTFVYFIAVTNGAAIKIGWAEDVSARLADLQVGNHEQLFVVAALNGSRLTERLIHKCFDGSKIRGEWYKPTEDILEFIHLLNGRQEDFASLFGHSISQCQNDNRPSKRSRKATTKVFMAARRAGAVPETFHGLSVNQIAKKLRVSNRTVSRWLRAAHESGAPWVRCVISTGAGGYSYRCAPEALEVLRERYT